MSRDGTGINANGTVAGSDGYTTPADADNNGTADHLGQVQIVTMMAHQIFVKP